MRSEIRMTKRRERDLFGNPIKVRRPRYEWSLSRAEQSTVHVRAARVRWLASQLPRGRRYMMPSETFYVFDEAKSSYVYGCFVATTILCGAFIEHWLAGQLQDFGFRKEARGGLAAIVSCCKKNGFLNELILKRVDRLRAIRNPFVHLKEFEHQQTIGQRTLGTGRHPFAVMEDDARDSLVTMYAVANTPLVRPGAKAPRRQPGPPSHLMAALGGRGSKRV